MTREQAICELCVVWERLRHPEACEKGCYSFRDGDYTEALDMAIEALSAESEDRHYIRIYADDEPSVKAEKLYQICDETQNREVAKWLKEYFLSDDEADWIPCSERLPEVKSRVLVTVRNECYYGGELTTDVDSYEEYGFGEWDECVLAWMPLPEPYEGVTE